MLEIFGLQIKMLNVDRWAFLLGGEEEWRSPYSQSEKHKEYGILFL